MGKSSIDDNVHIVCLQEGKTYTLEVLDDEIQAQLRLLKGGAEIIEEIGEGYEDGFIGFVRRLKESLQDGNLTSGDEDETNDDLEWVRGKSFNVRYIGLYAYSDSKGNELILYFAPKFVHARRGMDEDSVKERREQLLDRYDRVLLAIDRYQKDQARLDTSWIEKSDSCVGLLPLVVMLVRDYLEYGLYTVHYSELEHNGRGEIDWERTINDEKPFIQNGRPIYTDYWTEQTLSDENNYFTRLHACLLSIWANKLADYGLAEVLNIAIPSLSEAELGEFGDEDYICSRIRGELGCQFVTHFRRTLQMIEALVTRTFDAEALDESAFSFGMGGVAALWEEAINKVLGSQLDCRICDCGGGDNHKTFRESIPHPIWKRVTKGVEDKRRKDSNTWRPDFVRVGADENSKPVFVILDAKYYSVVWNDRWLKGEPGIESISKQFFYKRVYQDLVKEHLDIEPGDIVNAFVFPALGEEQDIKKPEVYAKILWSDQQFSQKMFGGGDLHAVKLSGLRLLDSYASYDDDKEEWMKEIIRLCRNEKRADDGENGGTKGDEVKGDDTDDTSSKSSAVADRTSEVSLNDLNEDSQEVAVVPLVDAQGNTPQEGDGVVSPIAGDCISKEFIRDVMSIPSCSGREEMMKEYIKQFATARRIEVKEDAKGNLYLTKGKTTNEKGYYPCLVNHMDTVQEKHLPYIKDHKRLKILERKNGDGQTEFYVQGMGIGADDKSGCAIALALLDKLPIAKAAFFVEEERGMVGSKALDREWFRDVGFCLSFDSPQRNRSSRTCEKEQLYEDWFFKEILKPICDVHGITEFRDEPSTDIVQIRQKTPIMCYNVGNGGSYRPHALNEFLVVEDAQAAYKFGFDLFREIGENRYWFGDDGADAPREDGGGTPRDPDPPETPDSVNPAEADGSGSVSSSASDVCNCRMESAATKSGLAQLDGPCKVKGLDGAIADDVFTDTMRLQTKERQIMPGLKIYHGSRIEELAKKLKECLLIDRQGNDPFVFSKVVVPNPNVAKWLQIRNFATESCLCAGIDFPLMEKRLAELMIEGLPPRERSRVELLPDHAYAKAIVSVLLDGPEKQPEYDKLAPFRRYIMNSAGDSVAVTDQKQAAMTWQLADKLADLMDSYEVHRPEIVEAWIGNGSLPDNVQKGETAEAEAALGRALWGKDGRFKPDGDHLSLRQLYDRVKDRVPDVAPQKLYFFGQSTFSVLQAQILVWLAKAHEVVVFHHNPCNEYWGDIETKDEERRALFRVQDVSGIDPDESFICENKLLKTLGIAGRETLRILVNLESSVGVAERIGFEWMSIDETGRKVETVLEKVQDSIRGRTSKVDQRPQDASVQIVGTPGVRREVEMAYNSILGSVARPEGVNWKDRPWPDCSFSDIAVIVPDMQTYRPVIEAVFDARGEVPYGLLDTTASEDSHYLRGFLSLIELGRKGFNRERLFNVLENPCVQRAMGFAREEVVDWRDLTEKIGAFDGFEHEDDDAGYFDWSSALQRLRLAKVANRVLDGEKNELPLVRDGEDDALKLSEVVELLYRELADTLFDGSGKPRELPLLASRRDDGTRADCWADRLARLAKTYLANDKDDKLENKVSASLLATLYSLGDIPRMQSFELAVAAVEHFVGGIPCRTGRYLTSGVTIGSFSSLSALPFKQVYMMGMGTGGFPGRTSSSTLDIRGTGWRLGDVSVPNRNRFLFLESIMSARDRLVLSYSNKDIEKDAEQFPSSIVLDMEKFIGKYVLNYDAQTEEKDKKFQEFKGYPLLERGEAGPGKDGEKRPTDDIVWTKDDPYAGLLPTYSKAARELARARAKGRGKLPEVNEVDSETAKPRIEISAKVLSEFLKNPVRAVMRYRFGISVAGYLETDLDPDSPLGSLQGPDEWNLQAKWLDPDAKDAVEKEILRLQRAGKMPTGFLGEYAKRAIMEKTEKGLAQIQDFVAGFELSDGEDNTLHFDFSTEFGKDETKENDGGKDGAQKTKKLKLRFVAEIPNWKETTDEVSVLVAGWLGKQETIPKLPTERCFDAVLAYLMKVHSRKCMARRLKVGVVDLTNGTACAWTWDGICEKAGEYLETLTRSFLTYEQTGGGKMIDFTCKKLLKALNDVVGKEIVWREICEKLTADEFDNSKSSFNNDLVIEQNLARFKREPEEIGEELKRIYEARYKLLLSGKRLDTAEKEVGHE